MKKSHESYTRLLKAAEKLKGMTVVADIARLLDVTSQTMNHWKNGGVAHTQLVESEKRVGALPLWIETGEGAMTKSLRDMSLTAQQEQLLYNFETLDPAAREALLNMGCLLSRLPKVRTEDYEGPERRYKDAACIQERRASAKAAQKEVKYA
jgi:hypothetical protein